MRTGSARVSEDEQCIETGGDEEKGNEVAACGMASAMDGEGGRWKGVVEGCGKEGRRRVGNKTGEIEGERERSKVYPFPWCISSYCYR